MIRAVTGFVTKSGTIILTPITEGRPKAPLKEEGFIFFTHHALFNRVMRDKLDVARVGRATINNYEYTARVAEQDFHDLAREA